MGCSITSAPGTDHSHGSGFAYSAYRRYARACKYPGHTTLSVFYPLYLLTLELIFIIYTIFVDTPPHPPLKKCISHRNASGIKDVVTCLSTPYQDMLHIIFLLFLWLPAVRLIDYAIYMHLVFFMYTFTHMMLLLYAYVITMLLSY